MKLSTKARYGIRALIELALQDKKQPMLLRDIAGKQGISQSYLEQIIGPLVNGGILRSIKGPRGGILLNKEPSAIRVSDIIRLLEGSFAPVDCVDNPDICERAADCVTRDVWVQMRDAMNSVLDTKTLQDLVDSQREKELACLPPDNIEMAVAGEHER